MGFADMFRAARPDRARATKHYSLSTDWGKQIDPEHVLPDYPRPQLERKNWTCLNGLWQYAITKDANRPARMDGSILVPFSPETAASGVNRKLSSGEYLWYQRKVIISGIPEGERLILHFGAVDQSCSVWWNGHTAGRHENGYLPFSMDVTDFLRTGENILRVRVRDDTENSRASRGKQSSNPGGMYYTAQSGIWQTVWMEWVPENYITDLKLTPCFDEQALKIELTFKEPADLEIGIRWEGDFYTHVVQAREIPEGSHRFETTLPLPGFRAWSPEDPYLYRLRIRVGSDQVQSYFAMRKFSVGMDENRHPRLFLNNEPFFFNGVLDQGYWPESLYTPPSDAAMVSDIKGMKELGFNTVRKHMKIEPLRWYYHCDRLGMIVWQDMVSGGGKNHLLLTSYLPTLFPFVTEHVSDRHYTLFGRANAANRAQWERECEQTVKLLYNCPCIGLWTIFNEGWGQFDAERLEKKIRDLDSTRLIDHASGWFDQDCGDIKSVHNYFRPLKVKNDRRPYVLTEYGGYTCTVPGHSYSEEGTYGYHHYENREAFAVAVNQLFQTVDGLKEKGLAGAIFTQLTDIEEETNGLYTWDRKICKVKK